MKVKVIVITAIMMVALFGVTIPVNSDQSVTAAAAQGHLELECNLSEVDLYLCPKTNFSRKTVLSFLGLVKSHKDECSGDLFFLGTTPFKPISLPAGNFVLLIPPQYAGEHEGPVEIMVEPGKKLFLMLKLFKKSSRQQNFGTDGEGPGDAAGIGAGGTGGGSSGGSSGGGSGSAGSVGTGAPPN